MIYTGWFGRIDDYRFKGLTCVSIAGKSPDWFQGYKFPSLSPLKSWWSEWKEKGYSEEWYIKQYQEAVLDHLIVGDVLKDFETFGNRIILLCYEKPYGFCHRHLVSA